MKRTERITTPSTYRLSVYGMRVRSAFPLSGWPPAEAGDPDLEIRREALAEPALEGAPHSARWIVDGNRLNVAVQSVARYSAEGGSVIRFDPAPSARSHDVELYLGGAMLGAILHQRGVFPLHAAAVAVSGVGVAFSGPSGAGKSTLVAALVKQGASFITDDAAVVDFGGDGAVAVWPGPARLKLDGPVLTALSHSASQLEPVGGTRGKFQVPVVAGDAGSPPIPLRRIYLLAEGAELGLEPVEGLDAVSAVVDETHFLGFAKALGLSSQVFRLAAMVAKRVPVRRLVRPRGLEHLAATIDLIQSDVHEP